MRWPTISLGECCEIVAGGTPSTSVAAYWDGDICWATPKDLSDLEGAYISDTPRKLTGAGLDNCGAFILPIGTVLFSSRAPIGHVAINTVPMATNQGFKSFIPKPEMMHPKFLYHWLRTNRTFLESLGNGATFKEVSKAIVSRITISLPPLSEQCRIAAILDCADVLRAKRRAALAQLDTLTQSIFIDMFGDPATNPKGMRKESIGELIKLRSGEFLPATEMAVSGIFPVYGGNGINGYHDKFLFEERQIIIGRVGVYCGCVRISLPKSWVTDNALYVSERKTAVELDYLAHALRYANLNQYASKSGQPLVSASRIYPIKILVPPLGLQRKFTERIESVGKLKSSYRTSLTELDALFASLQHRAFRGEL